MDGISNRDEFAALVERYQSSACSIALAIVGNVEASEEVAQEALLQAWRKLPTLRDRDKFAPWLRQLVRNEARDWLRRTKTRSGPIDVPTPAQPDGRRLART